MTFDPTATSSTTGASRRARRGRSSRQRRARRERGPTDAGRAFRRLEELCKPLGLPRPPPQVASIAAEGSCRGVPRAEHLRGPGGRGGAAGDVGEPKIVVRRRRFRAGRVQSRPSEPEDGARLLCERAVAHAQRRARALKLQPQQDRRAVQPAHEQGERALLAGEKAGNVALARAQTRPERGAARFRSIRGLCARGPRPRGERCGQTPRRRAPRRGGGAVPRLRPARPRGRAQPPSLQSAAAAAVRGDPRETVLAQRASCRRRRACRIYTPRCGQSRRTCPTRTAPRAGRGRAFGRSARASAAGTD